MINMIFLVGKLEISRYEAVSKVFFMGILRELHQDEEVFGNRARRYKSAAHITKQGRNT